MNAKTTNFEQSIFDEIEADIAELEEDFGDLGLDDDDQDVGSSELDELDAALAGSEFATENAESSDMDEFSVLMIADGHIPGGFGDEEGFFGDIWDKIKNPIKRRARKLIKKLDKLVRKFRKYRSCVPKVVAAVTAFKAKKFGTSLKLGWSAYRCIRSKS